MLAIGRRAPALLATLLLGLTAGACLSLDDQQFSSGLGQVLGVVSDASGEPQADVAVFLRPALGGAWYRATSDERGAFVLPGIPAGLHTLAALAPDGTGVAEQLLVTGAGSAQVALTLSALGEDPALYGFIVNQLELPLAELPSHANLRWHFAEDARHLAWAAPAAGGWLVQAYDLVGRQPLASRASAAPIVALAVGPTYSASATVGQELTVCALRGSAGCRVLPGLTVRELRWVGDVLWLDAALAGQGRYQLMRWDLGAGMSGQPQALLTHLLEADVLGWDACYGTGLVPVIVEHEEQGGDRETRLYLLAGQQVLDGRGPPLDSGAQPMRYLRAGCSPDGQYAVSLAGGLGARDQEFKLLSSNAPGDFSLTITMEIFSFTTPSADTPALVGWGWSADLLQFIAQLDTTIGRHTISASYRFLGGFAPSVGGSDGEGCIGANADPDCQYIGQPGNASWDLFNQEAATDDVRTLPPAPDPVLWRSGGQGVLLASRSASGTRQLYYDPFGPAGRQQLTFSFEDKGDVAWDTAGQRIYFLSRGATSLTLRLAPLIVGGW